jgi:hypothetical protein
MYLYTIQINITMSLPKKIEVEYIQENQDQLLKVKIQTAYNFCPSETKKIRVILSKKT